MAKAKAKLLLISPGRLGADLAHRLAASEVYASVHVRGSDGERADQGIDLSAPRADRAVAKLIADTGATVLGYLASGGAPRPQPGGEPTEAVAAQAVARGLELAARRGSGVVHLVVLSWTAVYGVARAAPLLFSESFVDTPDEPEPSTPVGRWSDALREAETSFAGAAGKTGASLCLLRSAPVVAGPVASLVGDFLTARFPMRVVGYDPPFQVIHYSDLLETIHAALVQPGPAVLNVAGRGVVRLSRLAALAGVLAPPMPAMLVRRLASPVPGIARLRYRCIADARRSVQVLGVTPRYGAEEALRG